MDEMTKREETVKKLRDKTWIGFLYSLLGVTLPFIISLLGASVINRFQNLINFLDDGQVLLISAGLFTSVHYILRDEENQKSLAKFPPRIKYSNHFALIGLLCSSVVYALIYTISISHVVPIQINFPFIRILSLLLFTYACYASFYSIYVDFYKIFPNVDVIKSSNEGVKDILNQL